MSTITLTHPVRPATRPARPVARPSSVRLTRRGRLVVVAVGLLVALLVGLVWGSGSVATERPGTPEPTTVVQVEPGDTLFAIAAAADTDGDVNAMIARIQRLNALDSGVLQVGQKLRVPVD